MPLEFNNASALAHICFCHLSVKQPYLYSGSVDTNDGWLSQSDLGNYYINIVNHLLNTHNTTINGYWSHMYLGHGSTPRQSKHTFKKLETFKGSLVQLDGIARKKLHNNIHWKVFDISKFPCGIFGCKNFK